MGCIHVSDEFTEHNFSNLFQLRDRQVEQFGPPRIASLTAATRQQQPSTSAQLFEEESETEQPRYANSAQITRLHATGF